MISHQLQSLEQLATASNRWDGLWNRSDVAFPSTQAELLTHWMQHFADEKRFCSIDIGCDEHLQAALPLVEQRWLKVLPIGELPGNEWSPVGNLLFDSAADQSGVGDALLAEIDRLPWPMLRLEPVRLDAPGWQLLVDVLQQANRAVLVERLFEVGHVSVEGDWETYFASRSRNLRKDLGKSWRRLEKQAALTTKMYFDPDDTQLYELMERGFAVEDRSWKGRSGTSVLKTPGLLDFYCSQAALLRDRGQLQLSILELDGIPIAFEYGWRSHATYFSFKVGYDEAYERHSPGQLLRMKLLEHFFADDQIKTVDFFGPLNHALAAWATEAVPIGRIVIGKPILVGKSMICVYRCAQSLKRRLRKKKHSEQHTLRPCDQSSCNKPEHVLAEVT